MVTISPAKQQMEAGLDRGRQIKSCQDLFYLNRGDFSLASPRARVAAAAALRSAVRSQPKALLVPTHHFKLVL